MWQVALGWHTMEFAQTSAILEFYIWFRFWSTTAVDMSFCTSLRNFIQIGPPSAEKITSCRFSRWRISTILDFRGPIMGSLKSPCTTSYRSSITFFVFWRQTDRQTNKQMDSIDALRRSRYRERRLNNIDETKYLHSLYWRTSLLFDKWIHEYRGRLHDTNILFFWTSIPFKFCKKCLCRWTVLIIIQWLFYKWHFRGPIKLVNYCYVKTWINPVLLSRVSILTRDIDIANLSVCLSVRLSVTFRYQIKTA